MKLVNNEAQKWTDGSVYFRQKLFDLKMSSTAKLLYIYLTNRPEGCQVRNKEMLSLFNCAMDKLNTVKAELTKLGLLEIKRKPVKGKRFYFITVFDLEN